MLPRLTLLTAAAIALFGALIHMVAPLLGPEWYAYLHAPPSIVAMARQQDWGAAMSALAIGFAMLLAGLYALAAGGIVRRLPLTGAAVWTLAILCCLRGLILVPLLLLQNRAPSSFDVVGSLIWLAAGIGYAMAIWRPQAAAASLGSRI